MTFLLVAIMTLNAQMVNKAKAVEVILKGGTLHTVSNGNKVADLHIKDGKILAIGNNLSSATATTVDCKNKHVYPGMIDGGTRLGLVEINAVSLTNDYNELGDYIPHMKALTAVNPNSVSIRSHYCISYACRWRISWYLSIDQSCGLHTRANVCWIRRCNYEFSKFWKEGKKRS